MSLYSKWAKKKQTEPKRILALFPAGVLFLYLLPLAIAKGGASLDRKLGLPFPRFRHDQPHPRQILDGPGVLLRPLVDLCSIFAAERHAPADLANPETAYRWSVPLLPQPDDLRDCRCLFGYWDLC